MAVQKKAKGADKGPNENEVEFEEKREKTKRLKKINPEYPRGIQKIASYSGVTRTMILRSPVGKNGREFDEIVNVYVYPDGIVEDYDDTVVNQYIGENAISKQNVRKYGQKNLSIWGRKEEAVGYVPSEARRKKPSKPRKRVAILHNTRKSKRK